MKVGESISDYFGRVMNVNNDMRNCGEDLKDVKIIEKILRTLSKNYNFVVCSIEESKDIDQLSVDELQSSLLMHELKVRNKETEEHVLKAEHEYRGGRGRGRSSYGREGDNYGRGQFGTFSRSIVECYRCHKLGRYQFECPITERGANYAKLNEEKELLLMACVNMEDTEKEGTWFLESGCSNHMIGSRKWFVCMDESFRHTMKLGNNHMMPAMGKGNVRFEVDEIVQTVTYVFYVPELSTNLLSMS
ncbi:uncharacterized protein LOC112506007 [Cynara cardunculus var. scolymus]|uniref:uncharacterized protein LOC112506007 n=1 Tax=Cynara cardunculus var. scolymus TaxID=59895 RepID=UPI000D62608A|nr:uncharacterized protein LOC112506007 [Cynara cardunculus var. scolymus]